MRHIAKLAAIALVGITTAGLAAAAESGGRALSWECTRAGAPTYAEVRDHFGMSDFHRAHQASLHLREVIKRACAGDDSRLLLLSRDERAGAPSYLALRAD